MYIEVQTGALQQPPQIGPETSGIEGLSAVSRIQGQGGIVHEVHSIALFELVQSFPDCLLRKRGKRNGHGQQYNHQLLHCSLSFDDMQRHTLVMRPSMYSRPGITSTSVI